MAKVKAERTSVVTVYEDGVRKERLLRIGEAVMNRRGDVKIITHISPGGDIAFGMKTINKRVGGRYEDKSVPDYANPMHWTYTLEDVIRETEGRKRSWQRYVDDAEKELVTLRARLAAEQQPKEEAAV